MVFLLLNCTNSKQETKVNFQVGTVTTRKESGSKIAAGEEGNEFVPAAFRRTRTGGTRTEPSQWRSGCLEAQRFNLPGYRKSRRPSIVRFWIRYS
jgi:hypothetical protein